jgi:TolB-like protein
MSKPAPNGGPPGGLSPTFVPGAPDQLKSTVRPELVQRHLEKVLVSAEMCRSKKLCQFLRFTVEEVLRGHGSELKEYAIAVGVFKRNREFDPGADPIVRVQARRLRSKLAQYYQTEGRDESIQIEYPVGGYSPIFTRRTPPAMSRPVIPALQAGEVASARRIAVLPFIDTGPEDTQAFADGLTDELIHALSGSPGIRMVARASCFQFKGKSEDVRRIGEWLGVSALVSGSVRKEGSHLRILVQLVDAESGLNLWSASYERDVQGILATQDKISREIAATLQLQLALMGTDDRQFSARVPRRDV